MAFMVYNCLISFQVPRKKRLDLFASEASLYAEVIVMPEKRNRLKLTCSVYADLDEISEFVTATVIRPTVQVR